MLVTTYIIQYIDLAFNNTQAVAAFWSRLDGVVMSSNLTTATWYSLREKHFTLFLWSSLWKYSVQFW